MRSGFRWISSAACRPRGGALAVPAAIACLLGPAGAAPVHLVEQEPVGITESSPGTILVDFGRVAFGNLELRPPEGAEPILVQVRFGEALKGDRIDRKPPGTVRHALVHATLRDKPRVVAPPADQRNTRQPEAVRTPREWGVVMPFRWVELRGWPGKPEPGQVIRRAAFASSWDDHAAAFSSSDPVLDRVWELCRYSIKATTFAGVYVDGDRERIPYEADAYLNQLSHHAVDGDLEMARDTFDRLVKHPTWPTEWGPHMVFMAHADWMHSGDAAWLESRYPLLKGKLLADRVRPQDGLVTSNHEQRSWNDIVDWPQGERDGFVHREVNTVVNAFHIAAVQRMADLAEAVGRDEEAASHRERAARALESFNRELLVEGRGIYRDGIGTDHGSQHASLFPLAFGLVPAEHRASVAEHVAGRGMKCSVYAAQYLMEGLFMNGRGGEALELMLADGDRSWRHMLESGTTITWEAWDQKYKPNQDWNHAWGAAPANLLPRFVLGARPLEPGWRVAGIQPNPGHLVEASGRVPTPLGPIELRWKRDGKDFDLRVDAPDGMELRFALPPGQRDGRLVVNGSLLQPVDGGWVALAMAR